MKKLLLLGILFFACIPLFAQQVYFIYIQSDTHTPFYVKMGDKVTSSTASGYVILSKLKDSTYAFQLGPSANESELRFEVPISGKDRGFLLKKFSDGWSLFDLQTMQRINAANSGSGAASGVRLNDGRFTTLLSRAANDTSLLYQPVVAVTQAPAKKKAEPKEKTPEKKEPAVAAALLVETTPPATLAPAEEDTIQQTVAADAVVQQPEVSEPLFADSGTAEKEEDVVYKRSVVTRRSESSTVDGFGLVYLDETDGGVDTIRLVIPNQKVVFSTNEPADEPVAAEKLKPIPATFSCNGQASEKEYFKLRRNLASIDSEADMTREAVDAFRKKCYTTEQIKSLSSLFLTQAGKYAFLEAAYPFVLDRSNFSVLQSELFDPAYLNRFKALTTN